MMRSILVPLDGSIFGEHAVPLAAGIARKANAMLHLVHVHQVVPPATIAGVAVMDAIDSHMRQDEEAYLADVLRRLEEGPPVKVKTALLDGEVSESLRLYSTQNNVDLVVLSTHGRGAMGRFWLGSIADHLIREMPTPVLLVRPPEEKADLTR
ncbi:MAG: universal stress protein, partial [Gemmataceae bacterium]